MTGVKQSQLLGLRLSLEFDKKVQLHHKMVYNVGRRRQEICYIHKICYTHKISYTNEDRYRQPWDNMTYIASVQREKIRTKLHKHEKFNYAWAELF